MKILLTRSNKLFSYLIRAVTWSRFSHCAVVQPGGKTVIDSTFFHGVKEWKIDEFIAKHDYVVEVDMEGDPVKAKDVLGSGYDYTAVFGIFLKRRWNDLGRWFCSELAAYCTPMFRRVRSGRVTPEHLFMVSSGYKVLKGKK